MSRKLTDEERQAPRFHNVCGETTERRSDGTCVPCRERWRRQRGDLSGLRWCKPCQEETPRYASGRCISCRHRYAVRDAAAAREARPERSPMTPEERQSSRWHKKCGEVTERDDHGRCIPCRTSQEPRYHEGCGEITPRYTDGRCVPCVQEWWAARDLEGTVRWCDNCQEETERNRTGTCKSC